MHEKNQKWKLEAITEFSLKSLKKYSMKQEIKRARNRNSATIVSTLKSQTKIDFFKSVHKIEYGTPGWTFFSSFFKTKIFEILIK